jgi:hypothetical protein
MRYRLHRAGICNVWQYGEQVFQFEDGRLLLRGKNGAGKSKALEMLLPFLLDGDVKRLDATGAGKTTFRWLMSEGATGVNRQGFLWLELRRPADAGAWQHLTLGAVVRWSAATNEARLQYFITPLRIGADVALVTDGQPLPLERLRERLGDGAVIAGAREYRARVGRELFGVNDAGRYQNLVHLLYRLRRPTIGDRIEAGQLATELGEALPPLDDDVLDTVAHNLDDLETVRSAQSSRRCRNSATVGGRPASGNGRSPPRSTTNARPPPRPMRSTAPGGRPGPSSPPCATAPPTGPCGTWRSGGRRCRPWSPRPGPPPAGRRPSSATSPTLSPGSTTSPPASRPRPRGSGRITAGSAASPRRQGSTSVTSARHRHCGTPPLPVRRSAPSM